VYAGIAGYALMYAHAEGHLGDALDAGSEIVSAISAKIPGMGAGGATPAYNLMTGDGEPSYLPPGTHEGL
jgi:hypothetical protein